MRAPTEPAARGCSSGRAGSRSRYGNNPLEQASAAREYPVHRAHNANKRFAVSQVNR